jgi:hypothetical protein
VPLYEKIVQLQGQLVELASDRLDLHTENQRLKQELELKAKIQFKNPYYYEEGCEVPICPKCYSTSSGKIRMFLPHPSEQYDAGMGRVCHNCNVLFLDAVARTPSMNLFGGDGGGGGENGWMR